MIFEKWSVKFDVEKLQKHLRETILPLEATYQSPAFGGWSVLSSTGSHTDGWFQGHKLLDPQYDHEKVREEFRKANVKKSAEYTLPTEICHGYLQEVIDVISSYQLQPHRARVVQLAAGKSSSWHRDSPDDNYAVRLHVPIQTNPGCFFETETEQAHLEADGSAYFLYVNRMHRVINNGSQHRYHLIMDVRDTTQVTKFHRYQDFMQSLKKG